MPAERPHRRVRRTWPQRLVLTASGALGALCLLAAVLVWYSNNRLGALERVVIDFTPSTTAPTSTSEGTVEPGSADASGIPTTAAPLPAGDGRARNFLLVGSDSRECIDPGDVDAGGFLGEGSDIGLRTDTILVVRADPSAQQAAILSFPRDLWVPIAGTNRKGRINEAFERENPTRLVQTIQGTFGVPIDHYVEVDFCAFKSLVDAVGGVRVPFEFPARDRQTGLDVPAGCVLLDGTDALRYVRSRYYEYDDGSGFRSDGTSDYGRIARQQDFIRRALQRAIDRGARNPGVAKSLLDTALENVRVDQLLTINDLLGLAGSLRTLDPQTVRSFRIEGRGTNIGGASVILPDLSSTRADAILDVFRGEAVLGDLPGDQVVAEPTTTAPPATITIAGPTSTTGAAAVTTAVAAPTVPVVDPQQPPQGIVPPDDPTCR